MANDVSVISQEDPLEDLSYPDSRTCLSLTYQIDDGSEYGDCNTSYLKGERAEHLPTVLRHIEQFLLVAGFDVKLSSSPREDLEDHGGVLQAA